MEKRKLIGIVFFLIGSVLIIMFPPFTYTRTFSFGESPGVTTYYSERGFIFNLPGYATIQYREMLLEIVIVLIISLIVYFLYPFVSKKSLATILNFNVI